MTIKEIIDADRYIYCKGAREMIEIASILRTNGLIPMEKFDSNDRLGRCIVFYTFKSNDMFFNYPLTMAKKDCRGRKIEARDFLKWYSPTGQYLGNKGKQINEPNQTLIFGEWCIRKGFNPSRSYNMYELFEQFLGDNKFKPHIIYKA